MHTAVAAIVLSLGIVGFTYARRFVDRRVAFYNHAPKVVLKDRPVWMSDFLADQIAATAQPVGRTRRSITSCSWT